MELEVRGLTDEVDTDVLILYLENQRRSGGGPVTSCTRSRSRALVTFENPSDAEGVLSREEHRVQSATIQVRRPPPWDPGRVALCGLNPETEDSLLELYVEKVSGREEFVMVRSSDRRTVLVTFPEPLSVDEFDLVDRSVARRPLLGSSLSVQRVRLCAEVLVENFRVGVSAELLEMYFESRRSGGGKVNSLTMIKNNSAAVVSFFDVNVVTRVLGRTHSLQNCQLVVSLYYPDLLGSPNPEETGAPEEEHPKDEDMKDEVLQPGSPMEKMEVQDCDPGIMEQIQDRGPAGADREELSTGQAEKPAVTQAAPPALTEATPPAVTRAAPPTVTRATPPAVTQAALPAVTWAAPSAVTWAAPPAVTKATPPAVTRPTLPAVAQTARPTEISQDMNTRENTGRSPRGMHEAEVVMDSSELRFMQEYHHELLAGMDQVTIVPLEAEDKCGFKVSGDAVSCRPAEELLLHIVSSLSSRIVTLQYPGVLLFLMEDEGQRMVLETERQYQCIIDTSSLSWKVVDWKPVDPWSFVATSDPSPVQSVLCEELSEAAGVPLAADLEDIKVFASLLKNPPSEEDKEATPAPSIDWNIKPEQELHLDTATSGQDDGAADEELEQVCKMSRDEFQDRELDEEAQLLLAIQMSMDTQDPGDEEQDLQRALALSLQEQVLEEVEEPLQRALEMSLRSSWAQEEMIPEEEDKEETAKCMDTAQIKVLAGDETGLVVACAALKKAVTGSLSTVTLDGAPDFPHKAEIVSALEKKHKVTIRESEEQVQIQGFLQNPLRCQEELLQILSALHVGSGPAGIGTPEHNTLLIPVSEATDEYQRVVQQFVDTLHNLRAITQVVQVQKVHNPLLYRQYQLKKQNMLAQRPLLPIERTLYHGTTEAGAKEICHRGFNRSFCGKNATFFGHGVYFAVEATISARDKYSPLSSEGHKFILVAQVLTGEFAVGKEEMRTPPIKPDSVGEVPQRYDSLADHLQTPSLFVIFNDTQAYPQYLITCCKKGDSGK